jgi:hypothetical protein
MFRGALVWCGLMPFDVDLVIDNVAAQLSTLRL